MDLLSLGGFLIFVTVLIVLDLWLFQRTQHEITLRQAAVMSAFWVALALAFNVYVFVTRGQTAGIEFFTGWLLEQSLSVDNLFVFLVVFTFFDVDQKYRRRVLTWGIIGAIVLRFVFIALGVEIVSRFHFVIYVFGAFLLYTGIKLAKTGDDDEMDIERNPVVRFAKRFIPITDTYHQEKFFIMDNGKRFATPLLLVLLVIESTDVLFAVDSIPAILGITRDAFIVFTSNIMAILGLRAMYFLLAGVMDKFHYLKHALSIILSFIGVKMLGEHWINEWIDKNTQVFISLGVILTCIMGSIFYSIFINKKGLPKDYKSNDDL